jgi:hypothetical protein
MTFSRSGGKIKWYVKPIVFGMDAAIGENVKRAGLEEHAQFVRWWNDRYRSVKNRSTATPKG